MYKDHETVKFVEPNIGIGSQTKPELSQSFSICTCRKIKKSWWSPFLSGLQYSVAYTEFMSDFLNAHTCM